MSKMVSLTVAAAVDEDYAFIKKNVLLVFLPKESPRLRKMSLQKRISLQHTFSWQTRES